MAVRRSLRSAHTGFTLVEVLITLFVVSATLAAVVSLFSLSGRIARVQTNVADMQQSLRVAQYDMIRNVRMAGRGGLPRGTLPGGVAVAVRNDIPETTDQARVAPAHAASPEAVAGSDILVARGVFNTPLFQVNPAASTFVLDGSPPTGGRLTVTDPSPSGVPQNLQPLIDAVNDGLPEALLLVSPLGTQIYAVVELDPAHANTDVSDPTAVTLQFKITGGVNTDGYLALSPGGAFPLALQALSQVGILEEHRYYVREAFRIPGDPASEPMPRLARARVYPGTDNPYRGAVSNLSQDIADHILDLQIAIGVDRNDDEAIEEGDPPGNGDEWVFNSADDDETDATQVDSWNQLPGGEPTRLYYLRINTVARTGRRDIDYLSPPLGFVEDRDFGEADVPSSEPERVRRTYRRLVLRTVVDLRNLS